MATILLLCGGRRLCSRHHPNTHGLIGKMGAFVIASSSAKTVMAKPNLIELGPPPGSNATAGFINAPTPAEADELLTLDELAARVPSRPCSWLRRWVSHWAPR